MSRSSENPRSLILCATQRTGSTMVYDDLRAILGLESNHAEILVHELFRSPDRARFSAAWPRALERNRAGSLIFHKVMFLQIASISRAIEADSLIDFKPEREFAPSRCDVFHRFFRDAYWVHLERRDVFAQTVSAYISHVTGVWHAKKLEMSLSEWRSRPVVYDPPEILHVLKIVHLEREQWRMFFSHYGMVPFRIVYEDAVENYPHYWNEVIAATGLRPDLPIRDRRELKLGVERNSEFLERLIADVYARIRDGADDADVLRQIYTGSGRLI